MSGGATAVLLLGMWLLSNGGFQKVNPDAGGTREDVAAFDAPAPTAAPAPAAPTAGP